MSTVEIGLSELVGFAITLLAAFWVLFTLLFKQFEQKLSGRFDAISGRLGTIESDAKEWTRLERELLGLKADMPLHYVRREDYVRNQTVIEAKLDALAVKLENWQLKEVAKHEH